MAGNSARRGAKRNPGSKKGASVGTGGQRRKALKGKGPTPKATERTSHPASRRAESAKRAEDKRPATSTRPSSRASSPRSRGTDDAPETVSGRNPVVEALRARVPASALYIAERIDSDDRVRESLKLAAEAHIPVLEAPRGELDRLGGPIPHQGLVLQVPAYDYAHPDDFLTGAGSAPWSSRSTASPTRATSAPCCGRPRHSAATASSYPPAVLQESRPPHGRCPQGRPLACGSRGPPT